PGLVARLEMALFQFELFYAGEKRLVADAEFLGCAGFIEVAVSEGRVYFPPLNQALRAQAHFRKRASEVKAVKQCGLLAVRVFRRRADIQIGRQDFAPSRENAGALDTVFEFANITGPVVFFEDPDAVGCELEFRPAKLASVLRREELRELA